jgi:hypothetical protein
MIITMRNKPKQKKIHCVGKVIIFYKSFVFLTSPLNKNKVKNPIKGKFNQNRSNNPSVPLSSKKKVFNKKTGLFAQNTSVTSLANNRHLGKFNKVYQLEKCYLA